MYPLKILVGFGSWETTALFIEDEKMFNLSASQSIQAICAACYIVGPMDSDVRVHIPAEKRMYAPRVSGAISEHYRAESKGYIYRMTKQSFRIVLMSTYTREILVI